MSLLDYLNNNNLLLIILVKRSIKSINFAGKVLYIIMILSDFLDNDIYYNVFRNEKHKPKNLLDMNGFRSYLISIIRIIIIIISFVSHCIYTATHLN